MTWTMVGVLVAAIGAQSVWIQYALKTMRDDIHDMNTDLGARLDRIEHTVLRDHGERIARLDERMRT